MISRKHKFLFPLIALLGSPIVYAQSNEFDLDLEDPEDMELLLKEFESSDDQKDSEEVSIKEDQDLQSLDEQLDGGDLGDDLDSLKEDIGEIEFTLPEDKELEIDQIEEIERRENPNKVKIVEGGEINKKQAEEIFEIGKVEKDLLEIAKNMQGKIPQSEWNNIAGKSSGGTYEVVQGDWLWKISQNIFGSGFYYSKIWALNPYITNPHEIEPGMILTFSTGSDSSTPSLEIQRERAKNKVFGGSDTSSEFEQWGDNAKPPWIDERIKLKNDGFYLQYSTGDTQEDLKYIGDQGLIKEYELYEPPKTDLLIGIPSDEFDSSGFSKDSKVSYNFKEGFYLNTFLANNIVQDFGKVESSVDSKGYFTAHDTVFVRFDEKIDVVVGDKFSVYSADGEKSHANSDRKGYKYTIKGSFEVVQQHQGLWEVRIIENAGTISRGDRVTVYTPKIERITRTYNSRLIEAVLISSFYDLQTFVSFGDVVYLDRGRADGVEVGNVFEIYGFKDRGTDKNIAPNPTYKNGELTVITVTDNFSTAIVTNSVRDFIIGDIAVTKTKEAAARTAKLKNKLMSKDATRMTEKAIDELDVELNLDDLNDSLLDKADKIQFTEDELAELERQEQEKSIISENERDLRALERLESELETAEKMLNEARLDEDRLLEDENLNDIEKDFNTTEQDSLDELEENFGKRYLDEDLNDKENPYGLTEFDIEEIDELLNADQETE